MINFLKLLFLILLFFLLALLQNSFLPHASLAGVVPNIIFILFFTVAFFEKSGSFFWGLLAVALAGFLLDVYSPFFFGASMIILALLYSAIKVVMHFTKESQGIHLIWYFLPLFLVSFVFYQVAWYVFSRFVLGTGLSNQDPVVVLAYNAMVASITFFIYQYLQSWLLPRQLKLF